ncbi:hypothetical protein DFJ43DRAFT_1057388 [Lentinula guzmanii]|uniref:MARVEL domain-containing protein n=1 Tax=Lentinula guzmanii TaxID=2804957 RepID=A0AA38JQR8_9AGAR|nr:hypothetical protein DFJ43DRAFT_1057388 [Lentinula guzmanii]
MPNFFIWFRYLVFALSIVCSAVIASVSVWNLGFAHQASKSLTQVVQVDSFVVFVGAFSLVGVFTIIFIEVGRTNAFTSRIWFDCLWSGFLFLLNISAASVVTALMPSQMCKNTVELPSDACTSTKVIQGFTWLITILLLVYFLTIFITVFIRSGSDSRLWWYSIYDISTYDRSNSSTRLQSPPSSPMPRMSSLKRLIKPPSILPIAAPRPQRPTINTVANIMPYAYRSGLSPDYQIEHFQFPIRPPPQTQRESGTQRLPTIAGAGPKNLYPEYLRSSLPPNSSNQRVTSASNTYRTSAVPGNGFPPHPQESPPPLGNWPRPDIMTQASRRSHRITPKAQAGVPTRVASITLDPESEAIPGVSSPVSDSRSKPTGPRTRAGSNSMGDSMSAGRPPPLDLTGISAFRPNR